MSRGRKILVALALVLGLAALLLQIGRKMGILNSEQLGDNPTAFIFPLQKACPKAYTALLDDREIDIRVVFGYKDARPSRFVGDRYEKAMLLQYLTAPCTPGWHACGFTRSDSDPDQLHKTSLTAGKVLRDFKLTVVNSAAGPDDDENRRDGFQRWMSRRAAASFLDGIEKADVVFYNGHSRDGGGPDFAPPKLTLDKHVDYDWYAKNRPGVEQLMERLSAHGKGVDLLGLFSCASRGHFLEEIRKARPKLATITSPRLLYYTDALRNLLAGLSAVMGQACESDFNAALRARAEVGNSLLKGLFP